jgi:hypothetical protein
MLNSMRLKSIPFYVLLLLVVVASGCRDRSIKYYTANLPVYQSEEEWRSQSIELQSARGLVNPGRIYVYRNLLLVNEYMRGVHIIDNTTPTNPINMGFLPVFANADIAVRNDILYLDSYKDLVAFDISNPSQPRLLTRVSNALEFGNFNDLGYTAGFDPQYPIGPIDPEMGIVVGWTLGEAKDDGSSPMAMEFDNRPLTNFRGGATTGKTGNWMSQGIAASTARFALVDHHLYVLNEWNVTVFDVNSGITRGTNVFLSGAGFPETLFPAEDKLFIGTTMGMLIYSLSNPENPSYLSQYDHVNSCDPVVIQGDRAYVTLSTGRNCPGISNVLEVVDISNINQPSLLHTYEMSNPRGLGVDENVLFICDGAQGLKVYDKTNEATIDDQLIEQFGGIVANDVIPMGNILLMTSTAGIYQYDYTDLRNITQLSLIPVQQ